MENIVLVDESDNEVGIEEKLCAHQTGKLHRAVSVFIMNTEGQMLLQQRAITKYHSGGLWANTCCGHPRPLESPLEAANRRLWEEMGIKASLSKAFCYTYKAHLDQGLIEHEFDHIFTGICSKDLSFTPNPEEVENWQWISISNLQKAIDQTPEKFAVWFKLILPLVLKDHV